MRKELSGQGGREIYASFFCDLPGVSHLITDPVDFAMKSSFIPDDLRDELVEWARRIKQMSFIVRYPEERLGRDWAEPVMVEIVEPKTVCVLHYRDAPYHVWLDRNLAPVQGDNWSFTFSGQGVSGILRPKNNVAVFHAHMVSAVQCTFAEIMSNPLGFFQHLANEVDARRLSWTSYIVANEAHAEDVLSGNPGSRQEIEELLNPEAVRLKDPARMPEPLLIYEYHADGCDPPQEDCAHVSCRLEYNRSDKAYDVIPTVCIVDCYLPEPIDPTDPTVPTPPPGP